jgi:hypothetical protein
MSYCFPFVLFSSISLLVSDLEKEKKEVLVWPSSGNSWMSILFS